MRVPKLFMDVIQYFADAMSRIFGLYDDAYPNIGVQPFEGDPAGKS